MKKLYIVRYKCRDACAETGVWANSPEEAKAIAEKRNDRAFSVYSIDRSTWEIKNISVDPFDP